MIIDYKLIKETNINFYHQYYDNLSNDHHLLSNSGEHYKLLTYISYLFDNITILDVGTDSGDSAIALAQNRNNRVITYDISKSDSLYKFDHFSNIEFKLMDIYKENDQILKSAKIIFLDIAHDGLQEKKFSDRLLNINYKGYLFCDDIFSPYHPNMKEWWNSINIEKYDLTEIGHHLGTGLINYYQDNSIIIKKM